MPAARKLPTVSVGIAAKNQAGRVGALLSRLLAQAEDGFVLLEIIVSCDGSTDGTETVVAACVDPRVRSLGGSALGQAAAQNRLLSQARGDLFVIVEGDTLPITDRALAELVATYETGAVVQGNYLPYPTPTFISRLLGEKADAYDATVGEWQKLNAACSGHGARLFSPQDVCGFSWPVGQPEDIALRAWCEANAVPYIFSPRSGWYYELPGTLQAWARFGHAKQRHAARLFTEVQRAHKPTVLERVAALARFARRAPHRFIGYLFLAPFAYLYSLRFGPEAFDFSNDGLGSR